MREFRRRGNREAGEDLADDVGKLREPDESRQGGKFPSRVPDLHLRRSLFFVSDPVLPPTFVAVDFRPLLPLCSMPSETMQAWVFRSKGSPSKVLHLEPTYPRPTPSGDLVLIKVHAVSLNVRPSHFLYPVSSKETRPLTVSSLRFSSSPLDGK